MELELTRKQFRRLLDMAYIGDGFVNSTRGNYEEPASRIDAYIDEFEAHGTDNNTVDC